MSTTFSMKNTHIELKNACKERGLLSTGKKALLVSYLNGTQDGSKCKKKSSRIQSRLSTMCYESIRDYVAYHLEPTQPEFTLEDKVMKERIFGFKGKTSFLSEETCKGIGDHIFGVREGLKVGKNWVGSESQWNRILVTHQQNVSYKTIKINGIKKNLAYDDFTQKEIDSFHPFKKKIFIAFKKWNEYVKSRGAHMYWENMRETDDKFKQMWKLILKRTYDCMIVRCT